MIVPREIANHIQSEQDPARQLALIKQLRNAIVGHDDEKLEHASTNAIPVLLSILSSPAASLSNRVEAATTIASFAIGPEEIIQAVIKHPVINTMVTILSPDLPPEVLAAALRTLSAILEVRPSPSIITRSPDLVAALSAILYSPKSSINVLNLACDLIPQLGSTKLTIMALAPLTLPLIQRIEALSKKSNITVVAFFLESALFAFSHILTADQALFLLNADKSPHSAQHALKILGYFTPAQFIASLLRLTRNPSAGVNVAAIAALTKLQYYATDPAQKRVLSQPLLPALIPYILDQGSSSTPPSSSIGFIPHSSPSTSIPPNTRVFRTFAILCRDDRAISNLALEAGVIKRLAAIIKTADTVNWSNSELISECLLGLAAMSLHDNVFREQVIATGVLNPMLQFMLAKPENPISAAAFGLRKIKIASCHLIRALARSISLLRTSLTTVDIVDSIYGLLKADPHEVVRAYERLYGPDFADKEQALNDELGIKSAVMAAVCNLVPEFSALREPMVERGFLELILEGAHSPYPPLRLNSLWALKHIIYALPLERKAEVMDGLSPDYIMELCRDKEPQIQEQILCFLRNFIYSKNLEMLVTLFNSIGIDNFLNMVEQKIVDNTDPEYLDPTPTAASTSQTDTSPSQQPADDDDLETNPFLSPTSSGSPGSIPPLPRQAPETFRWGSSTSQAAILATKLDQRSLILIATVYVLVHLAAISDTYKDTILAHPGLMARLLPLLRHRAAEVKVACCWVLINLAYYDEAVDVPIQSPPGASTRPRTPAEEAAAATTQREAARQHDRSVRQRVKQLTKLGFKDRIQATMNDGTLDVAQRAKYAHSLMEKYSEF